MFIPICLTGKSTLDRSRTATSGDGPIATMLDKVLDGFQRTGLVVVAALAFLSFRRLVPVVWPLFQASLSGLLIAAEIGVIFWLVYGGLASIGMPGLFWSPYPWTMLRSAFGVTIFVYWMLYLVFARDFEVHRKVPERRVWARFHPVLETSGLPALLNRSIAAEGAVGQLRWFLAYAGLPALLGLVIPAVVPAVRPGDGPAIVQWPWLAGVALGTAVITAIVKVRAAARLHEMWRQTWDGRLDLTHVRDLDHERLDPHANTKNILVIITVVFATSYLDQFLGLHWMRSLFPPAFSICVMLGMIATFATFLGTRSWTTRLVVAASILAVVAAAGLLDYEVEIRDLHSWYPSAAAQLRSQIGLEMAKDSARGKVASLESFQRTTSSRAADESRLARESLLDRWVKSFEKHAGSTSVTSKPILVVVTSSGGAVRAAIWTETVLGYLDQQIDDFPHHVRLMTGASGGMLGAARYVSGHADGTGVVGAPGRELAVPDYLTPIAWQIAFRDFFPNSLLPWATYNRETRSRMPGSRSTRASPTRLARSRPGKTRA